MTKFIITLPKPRFPLGQIVITANAAAILDAQAIVQGLVRHGAATGATFAPRTRR